jgi:hypothetical protein
MKPTNTTDIYDMNALNLILLLRRVDDSAMRFCYNPPCHKAPKVLATFGVSVLQSAALLTYLDR